MSDTPFLVGAVTFTLVCFYVIYWIGENATQRIAKEREIERANPQALARALYSELWLEKEDIQFIIDNREKLGVVHHNDLYLLYKDDFVRLGASPVTANRIQRRLHGTEKNQTRMIMDFISIS